MTRDELISECERRQETGADVEALIGFLRESGCSKIDCIVVLRQVRKLSAAEAKEIVHFSPTWSDTRASDEKIHEDVIDAATKLGFK
jgi:ribosomal protein L7/L12